MKHRAGRIAQLTGTQNGIIFKDQQNTGWEKHLSSLEQRIGRSAIPSHTLQYVIRDNNASTHVLSQF
jgi:hypothetical protein